MVNIRFWRKSLSMAAGGLLVALASSTPAQSTAEPRLGDPSATFDAALGPAVIGQSWWYYPLPDGSLARGAASNSSLEIVPRVLFLQRNWPNCADSATTEATRRQYLPQDAQKQWGSSFPNGGGTAAGSRVEGWYSDSIASMLSGSGVKDPGLIVLTEDYGFGEGCAGTIRLTFDAAKTD